MNTTILITAISALLGGGGIAALIQIILLPRTMARTRADTTSVLIGTATDTVTLVKGELDRSQTEIGDLRSKLSEARGRMEEQDLRIEEQTRRIRRQETEIEELNAKVQKLEDRVRAATENIDRIEGENP